MKQRVYCMLMVREDRVECSETRLDYVEVFRARRIHADRSRETSRARSPSPIRPSGKDASWRDKLGAGEKPAQRDTLDVEKPSEYFASRQDRTFISLVRVLQNVKNVEIHPNSANNWQMSQCSKVRITIITLLVFIDSDA